MKRALQNSMKSHCGMVLQCIGLFGFLVGTVSAQRVRVAESATRPATNPADDAVNVVPTANVYSSPTAAGQQILFSVELVIAGEPTLQSWFQQHSKESIRQFPGPIDKASPIKVPSEARLSLLTQLNRDAESSILASPALVTGWGRAASYSIGDFGEDDSFFSLSLTPKEVGGSEIGLHVRTRLRPKADDEKISGPKDSSWDVRAPLGNAFLFPVADVASRRKLILIVRPSIAAAPLAPSPYAPTPLVTATAPPSTSPARGFVAQSPAARRVAQAFRPPTVERAVAPEAAVLQMLVLDVDSKIANDVISKTRTFESGRANDEVQTRQLAEEGSADDVKEPASTSRSFTMNATLGKLFVADLRKQDESFKVVSRPQVRSLLGVAAALDVRGLSVPGQKVAGTGSLRIHVTPKKVDDELVVRTWLSLSQPAKPSPDSDGSRGPMFEAESAVKCPLGSSAVMVLGNDESERAILLLTDVVSVQQVQVQPPVAVRLPENAPVLSKSPRPAKTPLPFAINEMPDAQANLEVMLQRSQSLMTHSPISRFATSHPKIVDVQQEAPNMISLRGMKPGTAIVTLWVDESRNPAIYRVEVPADSAVIPEPAVVQASGVQHPIPKEAPKSEVQQVLDEVREMRKLIQGLRDDMSLLRDSVKQQEQKISQNDVWIQQGDSQVFARGRKIIQVSGHDPAVIEVQVLAADRLRLTGKKLGRTTLKCLFQGDTVPRSFSVEVFPESRPVKRLKILVPRAADHLPGERVSQSNQTRNSVAVQRGSQEGSDDNTLSLSDSIQGNSARRLIEEALKKETSIDIDDGTLLDAIRQLHETAGINIVVDTRALEEEGVSTDARVSIHVAGVSLRSVLKLLLTEHNLAVMIEDEVLKVTSKQRAEGRQIVVAYRVAEFVDQSSDGQAEFDELISLITTVVEPDSWQEVGGNGSVAANLPTSALVIRQTQDVHEQIQQLLSALRNWTETADGDAVLPAPIAVGVDELEDGRFSGFAPIENAQPSLGVPTPFGSPISTGDDSLPGPARPPGNTGAPIDLPRKR